MRKRVELISLSAITILQLGFLSCAQPRGQEPAVGHTAFEPESAQEQRVNVRLALAKGGPTVLGLSVQSGTAGPSPAMVLVKGLVARSERNRRRAAADEGVAILSVRLGKFDIGGPILHAVLDAIGDSTWMLDGRREQVVGYQPLVAFDTRDASFVSVLVSHAFSRFAEVLVVDATVSYVPEGQRTASWTQNYRYLSEPVIGQGSVSDAMLEWAKDDGRILVETVEEASAEIARMLTADVFAPSGDLEPLHSVSVDTQVVTTGGPGFVELLVLWEGEGRVVGTAGDFYYSLPVLER